MLKDLATIIDSRTKEAGTYALALARLIGARVTLVPVDIETALAAYAAAELRFDAIVAECEERREAAAKMVACLRSQGLAHGLAIDILQLRGKDDGRMEVLDSALRLFDLIIVEQAREKRGDSRTHTIEAMVFDTARPILIVPHSQRRQPSLQTALVAWDDSGPAARALSDAMPFLVRARHVEIVHVATTSSSQCDSAGLIRHLAHHGVNAVFRQIRSAGNIGNALLSRAEDINADLLVMGAYGHSRMREAILGGTTRTIMEYTTVPVLMSH